MSEISNKKKKFIKRNFKNLSIEELSRQTGLKTNVVKSIIDEYSKGRPDKKKGAEIFLSWKTILLTLLLFSIIAITVYSPSLHGKFIFDDVVIQNTPLIHVTRVSQFFDLLVSKEIARKIGFSSFALNYYFGGLNSFGYHLVNVIIHILNGIVLFLIVYRILALPLNEVKVRKNAFKLALLGSLLWMVHPIQSQSVAYIVQRLTSLSSLFFLLSLFFYIEGRLSDDRKRLTLFILSMISGILALGTKQNAATLPLFIILTEFFFFQHQSFRIDKKKLGYLLLFLGLFIVIALIYLRSDFISRMALQYEMREWTPIERMMTELRVVIFYISLLFYPNPSRLNLDHDFSVSHSLFSPPTTFLSMLFIIGSIALAIYFIKRNRLVSYALLWFFGNLVIESSFIPLELVFEHRLYLPSMGLIILFVGLFFSLTKKEFGRWITAFSILLILLLSYWTYERSFVWRSPFYLWMDAAKKSPDKARPHVGLGSAYLKRGMLDESISELERAISIDPGNAKAHSNICAAYTGKGIIDEAIAACNRALAIEPDFAEAYNNLGIVYAQQGKLAKAITEYKQAITINSYYAEAHTNLGTVFSKNGKFDEAIAEYKQAISIDPGDADAYAGLGIVYTKRRMLDDAISEYNKAIAIRPDYVKVHKNLALVYYSKGYFRLAISHCNKVERLGSSVNPKLLELLNPYR